MVERAPVPVGVVGTGALGRHHVRLLAQLPEADLRGIHDRSATAAEAVAAEHGARVFDSWEDLADEVDAVVVAVPTVDHARIGCELLRRGKHVLVETPIAASLEEARELVSTQGDRVLAVGHVEFYNPAVEALLGLGEPPGFVEVERLSPFTRRSLDVDVVLDLMIHDLQILHCLDPSPLEEVRAVGISVLSDRIDLASARLELASGCVANVGASRVSAAPSRQLRVFFPQSYYSLDYREQEIKGYRLAGAGGGRSVEAAQVEVARDEPLKRELERFLAACRGEAVRWVSGEEGLRALETAHRVLAAIEAGRARSREAKG
ncbi:MAG: Gfo/Idh/MocA family oxidoreductase [Thermoanaerobaculia bacterium]